VIIDGMDTLEPPGVRSARERARSAGFELSSENGVGALLASLAAAVRPEGTIVELGTGAGVGLAWIVHGIGERTDLSVHSVDVDIDLQAATAAAGWPSYVHFVQGDGARIVSALGPVDLLFADAAGGKTVGLDETIGALRPGGILVVDGMDSSLHHDDGLREVIERVRDTLVHHPQLVTAELDFSTGIMVATKRMAT
jgi:predicted O-methyltransferase YrrM